jgi:hypothetical protein
MKYLFEATEGKLEYLQDKYNEIERNHEHEDFIDFNGGLYLENRMWVNYMSCRKCSKRFSCYGIFSESDE